MGFRFRRSVKVLPGLRLNFSRSGASVSFGPRGFHYTVGPKGTRVTAGIPGTGLSWTQYTPHGANVPVSEAVPAPKLLLTSVDPPLQAIETGSLEKLNALSTSELAPILDQTLKRMPLTPFVLMAGLITVVLSLLSNNGRFVQLAVLYSVVFIPTLLWLDGYRRSIKIKYELEGVAKTIAETLGETFSELRDCCKIWSVYAEGTTSDWKRNAGATTLNNRKEIRLGLNRPKCIKANVVFPSVKTRDQELYFLPDALLVIKGDAAAALAYRDLSFSNNAVRFIEDDGAPSDTTVVGQTWRFVNKSGGPDRRFSGNRQLPICRYGEMSFRSANGLNCMVHYSNANAGLRFAKAVEILKRPSSRIETKAIGSLQRPRHWPTVLYLSFFLLCSGGLGLAALSNGSQTAFNTGVNSRPATSNNAAPPQPTESQPNPTRTRPIAPPPRVNPSRDSRRQDVATPAQDRGSPIGSLQGCLSIQDVDERIDCMEQFRAPERY